MRKGNPVFPEYPCCVSCEKQNRVTIKTRNYLKPGVIEIENMTENLAMDLSVPFPTKEEADIAFGTLSVDAEPKRGGVKKTLVVKGNILHIHFEASEARLLRVSVNSFFDHLNLVVQTIDQFGPPLPDT